jgi:hypothetical protein
LYQGWLDTGTKGSAIAVAARVKRAGKEFVGQQRELYLVEQQPGEESPYERLLGDAMAGDGPLFTREDAVEAAWAVVDPVLKAHHPVLPYRRRGWGPTQSSPRMAVGIIPDPRRRPDDRPAAGPLLPGLTAVSCMACTVLALGAGAV